MAVGSYLGRLFEVSDKKIYTPSSMSGEAGSDWAIHEPIGGKPRAQWTGPKLRQYKVEILLRAQDGVSPRETLEYFQQIAEKEWADWFIVGNAPISVYPFRLVSVSDEWDTVLRDGELLACTVQLTVEECLSGRWQPRTAQ